MLWRLQTFSFSDYILKTNIFLQQALLQVSKQTHPNRLINLSKPQAVFRCYTYTTYDVMQIILIQFVYINRKRSGRNIKILSKLILRLKQFHYQKCQLSQTVVWPKHIKEHHCFQDLWFLHIRDLFCLYLDAAQGGFEKHSGVFRLQKKSQYS